MFFSPLCMLTEVSVISLVRDIQLALRFYLGWFLDLREDKDLTGANIS